jgi:MFS family permease
MTGDLRRLQAGWGASVVGEWGATIALVVLARSSGGLAGVGLVVFASMLAAAVAAPCAGLLADRTSRRGVIVGSEAVRAALCLALAGLALSEPSLLLVIALGIALGATSTAFRPAQAALLPALTRDEEDLTTANVWAATTEGVGTFAGTAMGGLLLAFTSVPAAFVVCALLLGLSSVLVARIAAPPSERVEPGVDVAGRLEELSAGARAVAGSSVLRPVACLLAAQTLVAGMLEVLLLVAAFELLDLGAPGVGWLHAALAGGGLLAALVTLRPRALGGTRARGLPGGTRNAFRLGALLWGLPLVAFAAWPELGPAVVLLGLVGVGNTLMDAAGQTLIQRAVPGALLARAFAALESLVFAGLALGGLLAPFLVAAVGVRGAFLGAGLVLPLALMMAGRRSTAASNADLFGSTDDRRLTGSSAG